MNQLILIVEACSSSRSDYFYIKSVIDHFYDASEHKITPIYAGSKTRLIDQDKKILDCIKRMGRRGSQVFLCADYDKESDPSNKAILNYVKRNEYEVIWMNVDIEEVFLGCRVRPQQKKKEAERFLRVAERVLDKNKHLSDKNPLNRHPSSNILDVFDKYLPRKRRFES